jgi:hypothetical protein
VEPLNHTPLPHVNSLASKLMDGKFIGLTIHQFSMLPIEEVKAGRPGGF